MANTDFYFYWFNLNIMPTRQMLNNAAQLTVIVALASQMSYLFLPFHDASTTRWILFMMSDLSNTQPSIPLTPPRRKRHDGNLSPDRAGGTRT